jgi:crescentin
MASAWSFFGGRGSDAGEPALRPAAPILSPPETPGGEASPLQAAVRAAGPLDSLGQRNELLRVRFSQMIDRLDDLKSLSDDFSHIVEPIEALAAELPQAKARVMETEALLSREIESNQSLRREVDALTSNLSATAGELASTAARTRKLESDLHELDATVEEQRLLLREKAVLFENSERQLAAMMEQHDATVAELALKRAENEAVEQSLQRSELALQRESEQHSIFERESRRLQQLVGEQVERAVSLEARNADLAQQRENHLHALSALEARMLEADLNRQKADSEQEDAMARLAAERSSLALKVDAVTARLATTEHILTKVRAQFREKDEALRNAERSLKEALLERIAGERRLEGVRAELAHHQDHAGESQRLRQELDERCEMLTKALAGKDAALESSLSKAASLGDRLETLTRRYENDRMTQEAVNRRLVEELESERAERTLAQGALEIARENRIALQRQNEALKRSARAFQTQGEPAEPWSEPAGERQPGSNVSFLALGDARPD